MKNLLILSILSFCLAGCQNKDSASMTLMEQPDKSRQMELPDSLSAKRISLVLKVREHVANKYWDNFNEKRTEGTFIYFNGDQSEIFFPSSQVLNRLEDLKKFSDDYVLSPRTDTIPYHFELMISFDPADSARFYFDHPVQQFLSVEETGNYIPFVQSSEMWTTMVIHEMFHHFQYNNPAYRKYAKEEIGSLPFDVRNLRKLCQEDEGFMNLIETENDFLLKAIASESPEDRLELINSYLEARSNRMLNYGQENEHLERVENYYVLQEGSARYIEYQSMKILNEFANHADSIKIEGDPMFKNFEEFKDFDLTGEEFSYLPYTTASTYHYALGFNQMRLLDIIEMDYKQDLLNLPAKGLHKYLEEFVNSSP